ncbi:MAG: TraX family protein [Lachnospiraceae bacterium]|nr:TraX family protein [Lachnospiraceae bacterium]
MERSRTGDISGFQLKLLALVTMAIDHIGAVLVEQSPYYTEPSYGSLDSVLRTIGRLAFPLFCFFIVEGFHYTRNRKKYAIRLLIFALVSEIPFDMAFNGSILEGNYNNVGFTLLTGMLSIWVLDTLLNRIRAKYEDRMQGRLYEGLTIGAVLVVVYLLEYFLIKSDYGAAGVFAIIFLYLFSDRKMLGFAITVVWLGLTCGIIEFAALADLLPLHYYQGRQGRKMKYLFYIFYPVHLLILAGIGHALGWVNFTV